jgi:cellulose synthase/poly-beta-1,6-N-acetylglucosamine synthase-like glycosyltransferase
MQGAIEFVFWMGVGWLGYVYIGYPVLLRVFGYFRPFKALRQRDGFCPSISVLIAARNEAKDIGWKICETLDWDYPEDKLELLVASDASDDGTDQVLASILDPRFRYLRVNPRSGKQKALNCLAEIAQGELLFFTDANTHIAPDAARRMAAHFADPRVGCVTGVERSVADHTDSALAAGGNTYLDYESWVNVAESKLGSVLVCDGSIFCIRRSLFSLLHADIANDLETPLKVGSAGYALLFDPALRSQERATCSPGQDFARRRRICAQGLLGMWCLRHSLHGFRAFQFVSRKFLRWLGLIPLSMIFISTALLHGNPVFTLIFMAGCLFLLLAFGGWMAAILRKNGGPFLSMPFFFVMINLAAMAGVVECILGRRYSVWQQPSSSRGVAAEDTRAAGAR